MSLVLASGSIIRRTLLANAGLDFRVVPATLDEREVERPLLEAGIAPSRIALALAEAKAAQVSRENPPELVLGFDQVLEIDGERLTKPVDMDAAQDHLRRLAGRAHELHCAAACARNGEIVWRTMETARLEVRPLTTGAIRRYLERAGPSVLDSVGAYQLEGPGIQLFAAVDGDYFAILGVPLLALLAALRQLGALD